MKTETEIEPWQRCLQAMEQSGLQYGASFPIEFLEKHIGHPRDNMRFGLAISEIRKALERQGFYLSGKGQFGAQMIILSAESNADVVKSKCREATESLRRAVTLGENTNTSSLTRQQQDRHEAALAIAQKKFTLLTREQRRREE